MKERELGSYFTEHEDLEKVWYLGKERMLKARSHISQEKIRLGRDELFRPSPDQTRTYIHSRLYVGGTVREDDLADGQSWFYPKDKVIAIWEFLPEPVAGFTDPRENFLYRQLWKNYEAMLTRRFPGADYLMTGLEDQWGAERWKGFTTAMGYDQIQRNVFRKPIGPPFP